MTDDWRLIDSGPCRATYNMALDEAIATAVRKGNSPPTLRLYRWDLPSVSIGCFQKISDINIDYCIERDIPIVRRPTGGRAVLHNHELTYSFSVKTIQGLFSKGLFDSYKKIGYALSLALTKTGLSPELKLLKETRHSSPVTRNSQLATRNFRSPLCFQSTSYGEITINNKKVIGSTQKRWPDGLLQQGSIPYAIAKDEMVKVFRLESTHWLREVFNGLKEVLPELNPDELKNAIKISFEETFDTRLIPSTPSQEEVFLALELEAQKYLSPRWNFQR
ncbi:MAG: biotin/lipoate A/B protein ligase family protein [Nitrospirota bacterium]